VSKNVIVVPKEYVQESITENHNNYNVHKFSLCSCVMV